MISKEEHDNIMNQMMNDKLDIQKQVESKEQQINLLNEKIQQYDAKMENITKQREGILRDLKNKRSEYLTLKNECNNQLQLCKTHA